MGTALVAVAVACGTAAGQPAAAPESLLARPDSPADSAGPVPDLNDAMPLGAGGDSARFASEDSVAAALLREGLENLAVASGPGGFHVGFENRRYRHSATALGLISRVAGGPVLAFERRLGLATAAVRDPGDGSAPSRVSYPSDGGFAAPPPGEVLAPTSRRLDLLVGPLISYELGRIFDPFLLRIDLQPELRYNPWPGGRLRAAIVIPLRNDFEEDERRPDVNRVRPGPVEIEQFAWSPGAALFSGTAGLLGDNRYGFSAGVARPLLEGALLLDAQSDFTGFFALTDSGVSYSSLSRWTGFAGVLYRPPALDLAIRLRVDRFIHDDSGVELEFRRSMSDLDVAFSVLRVQGETVGGVRLALPIPPMVRPVAPIRVLPVDRFPFRYREEALPVGERVANVASREDFLRQLDRPTLTANLDRYRAARMGSRRGSSDALRKVSLTGMTGFVNTPWCGVMGDKEVEVGYNMIPKAVAYQYRGEHRNDVYYGALGFLPRLELGIRWNVFPGANPFRAVFPESPYVDHDRMFSARVEVIQPRSGRPGLAVGAEDFRGTRRFHSTYAVTGIPFDIYGLENRLAVGYAPHVFKDASRRTLDGLFGAYEVSPWRPLALALEHDSEKWNSMAGVVLGWGFRLRVALLDLEHLSFGAGWFKAL